MDAVDRSRDALQAVVLTRRPVPELRPALDESGDLVADALRLMRDSGVALPGYLLGMLAISDDANPMLGLGTGMLDTSQAGQDVPGPTAQPPGRPERGASGGTWRRPRGEQPRRASTGRARCLRRSAELRGQP